MKTRLSILSILILVTTIVIWHYSKAPTEVVMVNEGLSTSAYLENNQPVGPGSPATFANLPVPFISESPDNIWTEPWINACEEASIAMVEKYYQGKASVEKEEAKEFMNLLFNTQDELYGSNMNADTKRSLVLINNYSSFKGTVHENPSLEEIKNELRDGRPVISFHYGFDLKNKNISFLATGTSFHVLVIKGFDDTTGEFITNDNGDRLEGPDHRYEYNLFMNSIHDYVFANSKANGPARVIFTSKN